jgi:hypothetical protein
MMAGKACVSGFAAACALALPMAALAQVPSNYRTPGATVKANSTLICTADYAASVKPVANWQRNEALVRYGIRPEGFTGDLDHLVPVALGGSNDPDNLWPFHGEGDFTLEAKNALAQRLRDMVCTNKMSLKDAQDAFKKDWTKAYRQHMTALNAPGE